MNREFQLQLQAYLDGELPEADLHAVEARLQDDAAARDLLTELRQTRALVPGNELTRPVPESRDFYWSKIVREIGHEPREPSRPARWPGWFRVSLVPAGGVAVLLALLVAGLLLNHGSPAETAVQEWKADLPEAQMLTFGDQKQGVTVMWLSYRE